MNATKTFICQQDLINPLTTMGMQMSCILVLSHFFHLVLKSTGHSGPIAQILAGLVLGPSGLSRITKIRDFFYQRSSMDYYPLVGFIFSIIFMFELGLETDIAYSIRTLRTAATVSFGGILFSVVSGGIASFFLYRHLDYIGSSGIVYGMFLIIILAETNPPATTRMAAELKITTSDAGRLAISCAIINDLTCLFLYCLIVGLHSGKGFARGIVCLIITSGLILLNKYLAQWFNGRNRSQKYLKNAEVFVILSLVIASSMLIELMSFNSSINCFLVGLMFPREGKSARTLLFKLTYSLHNFILPIYFGFIGFQFNADYFRKVSNVVILLIMVGLSVVGKVCGTIAAYQYLKLPWNEGAVLGFLLNMKGHADLLLLSGITELLTWTMGSRDLLLTTIVLNTVISDIGIGIFMRKEEGRLGHGYRSLEPQETEDELRVLGCVYGSRHVGATIAVLYALKGSVSAPIAPYLMHLIELSEKSKSSKTLYHELEDDELNSEENYGGNDVLEINDAVDGFAVDNKILIHQMKAVSLFSIMYEDVCDGAEDLRVSIILIPFHKHQRIDGKMESGKEGIRTTNQRILRHAPCSVGIIVSRGPAGAPAFTQILCSDMVQHVATLFFGGSDDQEALACSKRIAAHPNVNLTVIRFVPMSSTSLTGSSSNVDDDVYFTDFYNRHVRSGQMGYVEKHVRNGAETLGILREIGEMYSLFIVGKGKRGHSPMTTGMSDWEECPELGIVGDILASSEFNTGGSVLIIQQHRQTSI
ncbi:hypothetical protein SAY87_005408 [Trapa incisa]|uniref:Cation/H+ exchanger domain-containing protein n=1 Tax=Trapa incisa TaxID=236973 RepID=A0AAN7K4P9_9MYRT|nr:hypothetical protein SAY87_005408 [Trapa incisa]